MLSYTSKMILSSSLCIKYQMLWIATLGSMLIFYYLRNFLIIIHLHIQDIPILECSGCGLAVVTGGGYANGQLYHQVFIDFTSKSILIFCKQDQNSTRCDLYIIFKSSRCSNQLWFTLVWFTFVNLWLTWFTLVSMPIQCLFNVHSMTLQFLFNVHSMSIQFLFIVHSMCIQCRYRVSSGHFRISLNYTKIVVTLAKTSSVYPNIW